MNKEEILARLKAAFETLDYISDLCERTDLTTEGKIEDIKLQANGELAELEELIIKLENDL
jgi:hypothetical protein